MFNTFNNFNRLFVLGSKSMNSYNPDASYVWITFNDNNSIVYNDGKKIVYEE